MKKKEKIINILVILATLMLLNALRIVWFEQLLSNPTQLKYFFYSAIAAMIFAAIGFCLDVWTHYQKKKEHEKRKT